MFFSGLNTRGIIRPASKASSGPLFPALFLSVFTIRLRRREISGSAVFGIAVAIAVLRVCICLRKRHAFLSHRLQTEQRHYLRLRGIDCPQISTQEGKRAKAFVGNKA